MKKKIREGFASKGIHYNFRGVPESIPTRCRKRRKEDRGKSLILTHQPLTRSKVRASNPSLLFPSSALSPPAVPNMIQHFRRQTFLRHFRSAGVGEIDLPRPYSQGGFFSPPNNAVIEHVLTKYSTLAHFHFGLTTRCVWALCSRIFTQRGSWN